MRTPNRKPGKFASMKADPLMTEEKLNELKNKLERLKKIQPQAAAEVSRLAELGDFSENTEYQMAKGRLRGINSAIQNLQNQIYEARIIKQASRRDVVQLGSVVTVACAGKEKVYKILGSTEADPQKGIISYSSPIGSALIGHKVDEIVVVEMPAKKVECKVIKIA